MRNRKINEFVLCLVTLSVTLGLTMLLNYTLDFNFRGLKLLFIVPIGSYSLGAIAVSGLYYYSLKNNMRIGKGYFYKSLLVALLCFIGVYYTETIFINNLYHSNISMIEYIDINSNSSGNVILFIVEFIGYFVGALNVYILAKADIDEKILKRYYKEKEKMEIEETRYYQEKEKMENKRT